MLVKIAANIWQPLIILFALNPKPFRSATLYYGLLFPRAEKLTKKALDVTTREKRLHVLTLVFLSAIFDVVMLRVSKLVLECFNVRSCRSVLLTTKESTVRCR